MMKIYKNEPPQQKKNIVDDVNTFAIYTNNIIRVCDVNTFAIYTNNIILVCDVNTFATYTNNIIRVCRFVNTTGQSQSSKLSIEKTRTSKA